MMRRTMWIGLASAALASACSGNKGDAPGVSSGDQATSPAAGSAGNQAGNQAANGTTPGATTPPAEPAAPPVPRTLVPLAANPGDHKGAHRWSVGFGGDGVDASRGLAMDSQGQVAITGYYSAGADFGNGQKLEAQLLDAFVSKYAADGKHVFTAHFGGTGEDTGNAVAFDPQGNVVTAGLFSGTMTIGTFTLTAVGSDDIFVAKLGPDGAPLWARQFGGTHSDAAQSVVADADGTLYVTGSFQGTMEACGQKMASKGNEDVFLFQLSAAGEPVWCKQFGERYQEIGQRLAVDGQGNLILLADFTGEVGFGGDKLVSEGNRDLAVVKLDGRGEHVWSKRFGSPFNEYGLGLAVDPAGNIVLNGSFDQEIDFGGNKLACKGESDVYLAKLSPDGAHLWSKAYGSTRDDIGHGVAVDQYGNIAATGWFWHKVDFGGGALEAAGMNKDIFLLKLSANGDHLWSRRFGAKDHDVGRGVAMNAEGTIAVTGLFRFTLELGGAALESNRKPEDKAPPMDIFVGVFDR